MGSIKGIYKRLKSFFISRSKMEIALEIISILGIFTTIIFLIYYYPSLPDVIPEHFDTGGKPDAWGSKWTIFILPIIGFAIYIFITVSSLFLPKGLNVPWKITEENKERQTRIAKSMYCFLKAEIIWLFWFSNFKTIMIALGKAEGLGRWFVPFCLIIILGTVSFYSIWLYRAR